MYLFDLTVDLHFTTTLKIRIYLPIVNEWNSVQNKNSYHICIEYLYKYILYSAKIEQKGMTFDHDFSYSFPLFSFLLKKEGRRKKELLAKIMIKCHAFLLDLLENANVKLKTILKTFHKYFKYLILSFFMIKYFLWISLLQ